MKAAELTGGGFYRNFSSKDQLVAEAIRAAFDRLFAMFDTATGGMTGVEALQRIATLYLEQSKTRHDASSPPYLCPLAQLGSELKHAGPEVETAGLEGYARLRSLVARCLTHLPTSEAAAKATNIVSILIGAVTVAGLAPHPKAASCILKQAKTSILDQTSKKSQPWSYGSQRSLIDKAKRHVCPAKRASRQSESPATEKASRRLTSACATYHSTGFQV